jgi:hypothetical protein
MAVGEDRRLNGLDPCSLRAGAGGFNERCGQDVEAGVAAPSQVPIPTTGHPVNPRRSAGRLQHVRVRSPPGCREPAGSQARRGHRVEPGCRPVRPSQGLVQPALEPALGREDGAWCWSRTEPSRGREKRRPCGLQPGGPLRHRERVGRENCHEWDSGLEREAVELVRRRAPLCPRPRRGHLAEAVLLTGPQRHRGGVRDEGRG